MCGIVGIRRFDGREVAREQLHPMTETLRHRGPDDEGFWTGRGVGLGHRRLAIIDVEGSRQPMERGALRICFNGEIFNYAALREKLAAEGHSFRTRGDTEALLALHEAKGPDAVHDLEGQFAYALWDERSEELWLHRDRLGVLPLYYYYDGSAFLFASEIKAILAALPPERRQVDWRSVKDYLAHRSVPWPDTLFEGIRKLPPGSRLRLDAKGGVSVEAYWQLPADPPDEEIADAAAEERFERALLDSVENRLVADVPVGAYLSGGLDSSLIVAMMARSGGGAPVETFSAGFDDPRFDELPHARRVSTLLGTRHHELSVKPADFERLWPRLTWHRDGPISEPADVAIFELATLARPHVKVLLSGEGSDELFAGYPKYRHARAAEWLARLPAPLRRGLFARLERAAPRSASRARVLLRTLTEADEADRLQAWFAPFVSAERDALRPGRGRDHHRAIWSRAGGDLVARMLYVDSHTWLVDNLLERGDRMAMAASVESRPPFMDHRVVELAFALPSHLKLRRGVTKWLVRKVARRHLPDDIIDRRKVGFRVPLDLWFRRGLREMARDRLLSSDSFVGGNFGREPIRRLLDDHESGRRDEEIRIWTLLGLDIWHEVFFRRDASDRP